MKSLTRFPLLAVLMFGLGAASRAADTAAGTGDLSDFPHPAGLVRTSYSETKRPDRVQEIANYHAAADADALLADYRRELSAAGWKQGAASDSGTGVHRVVMIDWRKTGRDAELRLYPSRKGGTDVWARVNTDPSAAPAPAPAPRAAAAEAAPSANSAVLIVPSVVGKPAKDAEWSLKGGGFAVTWAEPVVQFAGPGDHRDRVRAQEPAAGARVARGAAVTLTATHFMASVPRVAGMTRARAEETLSDAHLRMQPGPDQATTVRNKAGTAAASQPAAGERVLPDSDVAVSFYQLAGPVPDVVGRTLDAAKTTLQGPPGGPRYAVVEAPPIAATEPRQPGRVASQDPAAGTVAMNGAAVRLTPWADNAPVPNLVGKLYVAPGTQLGHAGPGINFIIRVDSTKPTTDSHLARTVAEQSPAAGQRAPNGSEIAITVWTMSGPVPNVVGKTYADAAQALRDGPGGVAKFVAKPGLSGKTHDKGEAERVSAQSPAAGTVALDGSTVTLFQKALVQRLPDVVGNELDSSRRMLERFGYLVQIAPPRPTDDSDKDGLVAAQAPAAGTLLAAGETVTLTAYAVHPPQ